MLLVMMFRAVINECSALKPCWCSVGVKLKKSFSSRLSLTLAIGESSAIGRKLLESSSGLPGFCNGILLPTFHPFRLVAVCVQILSSSVRYCMAIGPR